MLFLSVKYVEEYYIFICILEALRVIRICEYSICTKLTLLVTIIVFSRYLFPPLLANVFSKCFLTFSFNVGLICFNLLAFLGNDVLQK